MEYLDRLQTKIKDVQQAIRAADKEDSYMAVHNGLKEIGTLFMVAGSRAEYTPILNASDGEAITSQMQAVDLSFVAAMKDLVNKRPTFNKMAGVIPQIQSILDVLKECLVDTRSGFDIMVQKSGLKEIPLTLDHIDAAIDEARIAYNDK